MEVTLTEQPTTETPPTSPPDKPARKHGGARPNSGGPRPNSGRPRKTLEMAEAAPKKFNLSEADLSPARRSQLVLPPLPGARNCRPAEFVKWWHSLTEEHLKHLCVYVYRTWPQIDNKRLNPKALTNIAQFTSACPFGIDSWEIDIMREFGSGTYRFAINEDSINRWNLYSPALRDLENYPPLIDYRTLMIDEPANKDFVDWARTRGKLDSIGLHNEESDMASAAVEQMSAVIERQSDRMMDLADRVAEKGERASSGGTEGKLVDMVMEVSKRANETAMDAVRNAAAVREQQTNPMEILDRIISTAQTLNGGNNNNNGDSPVLALMTKMLEAAERRAERAEDAMNLRRESKEDDDGLGGLGKLSGIVDQLASLGIVKKPGSSAEQEETASAARSSSLKDQLLSMALSKLPEMIGPGGLNALLGNFAAIIAAARATPAAPGAASLAGTSQTPAALTAPAPPPAPIMLDGFPMPAPTGMKEIDEIRLMVWRITPTLLHHMNADTLSGYTFARWLIDSSPNGRQTYDQMKEAEAAAPNTIKSVMLEGYKPLWDVISKTPAKVDKFLMDLLRLDEWEKEQDELDNQDDDEPGEPALAKEVTGKVIKS